MTERESLAGRVVGNWRLSRLLGEGAFGAVYEAENITIAGRRAAVKILHPEMSVHATVKQRFLNEASAASRADHENIVQIFDGGITADGICYSVMELLRGSALSDLVQSEGRLPVARAIKLCLQIAHALEAAHAINVVHRDLKPDNIFVVQRASVGDFVKVLDFGVAKLRGEIHGAAGVSMTGTGMMIGTPGYMSPEQWMTMPDVDGRADIYALGIILFECLTGRLPFSATTPYEWLTAHLEQPLPDLHQLASVPDEVAAVVRAMAAKKREERPQTMRDVATALEHALASTMEAAQPRRDATPVTPVRLDPETVPVSQRLTPRGGTPIVPRPPQKRFGVVLAVIAAVVLLGTGVAGLVHNRGTAEPEEAPPPPPTAEDSKGPVLQQVDRLVRKGQRAAAGGDFVSAVSFANQALAIVPGDPVAVALKETEANTALHGEECRTAMLARDWERAATACNEISEKSTYWTLYPDIRERIKTGYLAVKLPELKKLVAKKDCAQATALIDAARKLNMTGAELDQVEAACSKADAMSEAGAEKILQEAQDYYVHGQYPQAIATAKKALKAAPLKAWRTIGASSCFMKDKATAVEAWNHIDTNGRNLLKYVCSRSEIALP